MLELLFWVYVASAGTQLFFLLSVIVSLKFYRLPQKSNMEIPGISIVISAKNELENLKVLIPNLLEQACASYEIILIDDRSTDGTYDYAIDLDQREEKFRLVRIDSTPDHINNKKYALTLGIRAAKYEYILLTDADCIPESSNWIREMSRGFNTDKKIFSIGYSQYLNAKGFLNQFIKYETILTAINYFGIGLLGKPYMAVGRNIAYRKSFFLDNNGFGKFQNVVGGDDDLLINQYAKRNNTSFILSQESIVYSIPKKKWSEFFLQKTRHLAVGKHYKLTDKLLLGILTLSKIVFWASFITAIMSAFKTYFVLAGFFIVMVSLLTAILLLKKKTGDKSSIWMLPILDFIFIFYYISTGLKVLLTKKVRWK
ncbi:MAG: glycosyltransferase [Cytophagales bacterium]|nr:glycosyltransferase [Cytophagales bacterium]